jgi:hypothetical protein
MTLPCRVSRIKHTRNQVQFRQGRPIAAGSDLQGNAQSPCLRSPATPLPCLTKVQLHVAENLLKLSWSNFASTAPAVRQLRQPHRCTLRIPGYCSTSAEHEAATRHRANAVRNAVQICKLRSNSGLCHCDVSARWSISQHLHPYLCTQEHRQAPWLLMGFHFSKDVQDRLHSNPLRKGCNDFRHR